MQMQPDAKQNRAWLRSDSHKGPDKEDKQKIAILW